MNRLKERFSISRNSNNKSISNTKYQITSCILTPACVQKGTEMDYHEDGIPGII